VKRHGCLGLALASVFLAAAAVWWFLNTTVGGLVGFVAVAGMAVHDENGRYQTVDAQVVSVDRRCSDDRQAAFQDMAGCSGEDVEQRYEGFKAARRLSRGGKRMFPAPGKVVATLTYVGPDRVERSVIASASSMEEGFYAWSERGTAKVQVCKANPIVWRTSSLDSGRC
jgi:hypothetical protein